MLLPADLTDLAREATAIARGRVIVVEPRWSDDRRTIETLVTLEVETYLKGALGPTLQFGVPGGVVGRYRRVYVGAPELAVNERVIVFLGSIGPGIPYVLGMSQGLFRVARSPDGSTLQVSPPPIVAVPGVSAPVVRGDSKRQPMPLAEFERRVRELAGRNR